MLFAFRFCSFLHIQYILHWWVLNLTSLSWVTSRSLTPGADSPEDELPFWAWAPPNQTQGACCVLNSYTHTYTDGGLCWIVHWKVTEFYSRCRQENRRKSTFFFTPQPLTHKQQQHKDALPPSVLFVDPVLQFIFRMCCIQPAYFLRHTHIV